MKSARLLLLALAVACAASLAMIAACSKKSSPTSPGGGGGGGLELNSGNLASGAAYQHTFATAGTFGYHCTIHGTGMAGSVTVAATGPASANVTIGPTSNTYSPASVAIITGGFVRWTNSGSATHTVTSN